MVASVVAPAQLLPAMISPEQASTPDAPSAQEG